jgi:hypothetical protein
MKGAIKLFLIYSSSVFLIGCSDYKAEVESDTCWSGWFGDRTVDGSGNMVIDLDDDEQQCCTIYKQTAYGRLSIRIINESIFYCDGEDAETWAAFGGVEACSP